MPQSDEAATVRSLRERGVICWDHLIQKGCADSSCTLLHICAPDGTPACGRHVTETLCLWGRRRRPPCTGDCDRVHLPLPELVHAVEAGAARCGQRLHMRRHEAAALSRWTALHGHTAPTCTAAAASERGAVVHAIGGDIRDGSGNGSGSGGDEWSFHVVPQGTSDDEVAAVLAQRRTHGSRQPVGKPAGSLRGAAAGSPGALATWGPLRTREERPSGLGFVHSG